MRIKKRLSRQEVLYIKKRYNIRMGHFVIRENGLIDVNGDVYITNTTLKKLPLFFGKIQGDFYCSANKLTTLEGCPAYVGGVFNCYDNNLKSLAGGPEIVESDFSCHENKLTSLKGCPDLIKGNFNAFLNEIATLSFAPKTIEGSFYIHNNNLISLHGQLKRVGGSFHVSANFLNDLVGCPEYIGDILCFDNDVKLDLGTKNCIVKKIVIQVQERVPSSEKTLPKIVIDNQDILPVIFKYNQFIDLYEIDGFFNISEFKKLLLDIKEGLR